MKISVIIPAFNEEEGIGVALEALLLQDYSDFEVIVVDNASTDRTSAVARRYCNQQPVSNERATNGQRLNSTTINGQLSEAAIGRSSNHASVSSAYQSVASKNPHSVSLKVLSETRKGTMWACECGHKEASGEIIVRMDADCRPEPSWLSRGAAHFNRPEVVLASGPYDYHETNPIFRFGSLFLQILLYTPTNTVLQWLGIGAISLGGNTFLRATTLEKMGGFNTALTFFGDDTDTAKRAARFGKVVFDSLFIIKTAAPRGRFGGNKKIYKYWLNFFKVIFSK